MAPTMLVEVCNALAVVALSVIAYQLVTKVLWDGLWEPLRFRRIMVRQGVKALPFRFLIGQLPDQTACLDAIPEVVPIDSFAALSPSVTPLFALFFPKFPGEKYYLCSLGKATRLVVRDPEIARELFISNYESLIWSPSRFWFTPLLLGNGLSMQTGEKWVTERRIINPFFHQAALKGMLEAMVEGSAIEIRKWVEIVTQAGGSAEIDIEADVHTISGRVLSMTAFGGDFEKGVLIYKTQREAAMELMKTIHDLKFWLIPFYRKMPTNQNKRIDEMLSKLDNLLHELIHRRLQAVRNMETSSFGSDLLGSMLAAATDDWEEETPEFNLASVLHNCKLFYFAGQDTVANTVLFTLLMLASRPEWQARARKEVLEILSDEESFSPSALSRLKVVGMILKETMRTFTPAPSISRVATKDLHLKNLFIPKGMTVEFAIGALHQDKQYWGDDVGEFKPERFENGVSGACSHPQAFNPFGLGPRKCIGNSFAVMEMKIVLATVLRRFEVLPSPKYKHHPILVAVTRPKFGLPVILKAL